MCCRFDVAGAGACLKRFTDPSFFKTESTLLSGRKLEGQREKKTRRVKVKLKHSFAWIITFAALRDLFD